MYIRFGELPENGRSKIWKGEVFVGEEIGVSVYEAKIDDYGNVSVCLSLPITRDAFDTFRMLIEYSDRPCYLVSGKIVGRGNDNEPLISDVEIIEELKAKE